MRSSSQLDTVSEGVGWDPRSPRMQCHAGVLTIREGGRTLSYTQHDPQNILSAGSKVTILQDVSGFFVQNLSNDSNIAII